MPITVRELDGGTVLEQEIHLRTWAPLTEVVFQQTVDPVKSPRRHR